MKTKHTLLRRTTLITFVLAMFLVCGSVYAQNPTMAIKNIYKESTTSLVFSVYYTAGASTVTYSGSQLDFDFNKAILGAGTGTLTVVESDLVDSLRPRNPMVDVSGTTGLLKTAAARPPRVPGGSNVAPVLEASQSILIAKFRLTNTTDFAAGQALNLAWKTSGTDPYTKVGNYVSNTNTEVQSSTNFTAESMKHSIAMKVLLQGFFDPNTGQTVTDIIKATLLDASFAFVDSNSAVCDANGNLLFVFGNALPSTAYWVKINHRNHLETWFAATNTFTDNFLSYDMSTDANKAYGDNLWAEMTTPTVYTIYAGDANQDGEIGALDMNEVDAGAAQALSGYEVADINGDGEVGALDMNYVDSNSSMAIGKITPMPFSAIKKARKGFVKINIENNH